MNVIQWCNDNNGFLTAILSLIGLILSVTAIVVSIRTARLPYKKKLLLGSSILLGVSRIPLRGTETSLMGLSSTATNVGNRTISLHTLASQLRKAGNSVKCILLIGHSIVEKHLSPLKCMMSSSAGTR